MTSKKMGRTVSPPSLQLEDCLGSYGALGEIRSGSRYRKETIQDIKVQLSRWMANENFEPIKGEQLDVAIVIKCSPYRFKNRKYLGRNWNFL